MIMKDKIQNMFGAMNAHIHRKAVVYAASNIGSKGTTDFFVKLAVSNVLKGTGQKQEAENYLKKELSTRWAIGMYMRHLILKLIAIRWQSIDWLQKRFSRGIYIKTRSFIT